MKKLLFGLTATLILTISMVSCSKDGDDGPPPKTKTELISQQSWKFSSANAGGTDVSGMVDACYKDNLITFNATGGTGNVNEGANVCSPSTAGNFTWSFQNNETQLQVSASLFPGGTGNLELVSLTETTVVVAQDMTFPPFPTTNVRVTLVH
jgi:hypothetical protein